MQFPIQKISLSSYEIERQHTQDAFTRLPVKLLNFVQPMQRLMGVFGSPVS
jgi:hypothetical protein